MSIWEVELTWSGNNKRMSEPDSSFMEPLLRLSTSGEQRLSNVISSLREIFEAFPQQFPAFLASSFLCEVYGKHMRVAILVFLGQLHQSKTGVSGEAFLALIGKTSGSEKFLLYEVMVKKNIDVVG